MRFPREIFLLLATAGSIVGLMMRLAKIPVRVQTQLRNAINLIVTKINSRSEGRYDPISPPDEFERCKYFCRRCWIAGIYCRAMVRDDLRVSFSANVRLRPEPLVVSEEKMRLYYMLKSSASADQNPFPDQIGQQTDTAGQQTVTVEFILERLDLRFGGGGISGSTGGIGALIWFYKIVRRFTSIGNERDEQDDRYSRSEANRLLETALADSKGNAVRIALLESF